MNMVFIALTAVPCHVLCIKSTWHSAPMLSLVLYFPYNTGGNALPIISFMLALANILFMHAWSLGVKCIYCPDLWITFMNIT